MSLPATTVSKPKSTKLPYFNSLPDDVMLHLLRVCMSEMKFMNSLSPLSLTNNRFNALTTSFTNQCRSTKSNIAQLASVSACDQCVRNADERVPTLWTLREIHLFTHTRTSNLKINNACDHVLSQILSLAHFSKTHFGLRTLKLTQRKSSPDASTQLDSARVFLSKFPKLTLLYLTNPSNSLIDSLSTSTRFLRILHLTNVTDQQIPYIRHYLEHLSHPLEEIIVRPPEPNDGINNNNHINNDDSDINIQFEYTLQHPKFKNSDYFDRDNQQTAASIALQRRNATTILALHFITQLKSKYFEIHTGHSNHLRLENKCCDLCDSRERELRSLRVAYPNSCINNGSLNAEIRHGKLITPLSLSEAVKLRQPDEIQPIIALMSSEFKSFFIPPPPLFPLYYDGCKVINTSVDDVVSNYCPVRQRHKNVEYSTSGTRVLKVQTTFVQTENDYDDEWNNSFYLVASRTLSKKENRATVLRALSASLSTVTTIRIDPFYWWCANVDDDRDLVMDILERATNIKVLDLSGDAVVAFAQAGQLDNLLKAVPGLCVLHVVGGVTFWNREGENCIKVASVLPQLFSAIASSDVKLTSIVWHLHRTHFRAPIDHQYIRKIRDAVSAVDEFRAGHQHVDVDSLLELLSSKLPKL